MIDIHSHTVYSDGSDSVEQLLKVAQSTRLEYLSITDHNTVEAYNDVAIINKSKLFDGYIIPGVEITTTYKGEIVEVLGYGFDIQLMSNELKNKVLSFKDKQLKEYRLIKDVYTEANIIFDETKIVFDPQSSSCRKAFWQEIIKYPENVARLQNSTSIESSSKFTRQEVYNPDSNFYVDESGLYPELSEVVEMIHNSNGIAFLAHLYIYANAESMKAELLDIVNKYKFDGIECFYSTFSDSQSLGLVDFCESNGLLKSGGSDYHGSRKVSISLGYGKGNLKVQKEVLANWPQRILDTKF